MADDDNPHLVDMETADSVSAEVKEEWHCSLPITVSEEGVVNLWREIGSAKGFSTDTDLAKFLTSLYMNYNDLSPENDGSGDVTTGRLQTDRPSWQQGSTQTDDQCNKCSRPLALVCINSQCQSSPLGPVGERSLLQAASGKTPTSRLPSKKLPGSSLHPERRSPRVSLIKYVPSSSQALLSDVESRTDPSSGDETDVEDFSLSGFEAASSAEERDVDSDDTVITEGRPAQTKRTSINLKKSASKKKRALITEGHPAQTKRTSMNLKKSSSKKKRALITEGRPAQTKRTSMNLKKSASKKKRALVPANQVDNDLRSIMKPHRCDIPKYAAQTSADRREKTDTSDSSAKRPRGRPRKLKSNFFVESGAEPIQTLQEKSNGTESRKRTTADRSAEDTKENTDQTDTGTPPVESVGGPPDMKIRCMPPARDDAAETATSPRATSPGHCPRRSTGPLELVQPAEEAVTTETGKYPIVDGVAYKNGKIPRGFHKFTEFKCSQCDKRFACRLHINRHIRNPSCDDWSNDIFKGKQRPMDSRVNPPRKRGRKPKTEGKWTPKSTTKGDTKEFKNMMIRFNSYQSVKAVTLQEFMTGRIQVPIKHSDIPGLQKEDKRRLLYSHYTCFKCYTVFEIELKLFVKHEEECNGIRDRNRTDLGSQHQAFEDRRCVEEKHMAWEDTQCIKLEDADMTSADSHGSRDEDTAIIIENSCGSKDEDSSGKDAEKADIEMYSQGTKDVDTTAGDSLSIKDVDTTAADNLSIKDVDTTTADSLSIKDTDTATVDSHSTGDLAKTILRGLITKGGTDRCPTDDSTPRTGGEERQLDAKSIEILTRIKERYLFCCPHCDVVSFNKEQQEMHTISHYYTKEAGVYTCQLCNETFQKHVNFHIHWRFREQKGSSCGQCGQSFISRCQVKPHMKTHRKESGRLKAQTKAQARARAKSQQAKRKARPAGRPPVAGSKEMLCPVCGKVYPSQRSLRIHLKSHSEEKLYPCSVCDVSLKSKSGLRLHEIAHNGPQYQCEVCGMEYFTKRSLEIHTKIKHMGQVFRCEQCGKELSGEASLATHVRKVHLKIKTHICSDCGLRTSCKTELNIHMRTHSGEKPFPCQICFSRFARVDYLTQHMRIHTGERPYKCDDCTQGFVCATSLKNHRSRHHRDKMFPCDVCSKVLLTSASRDFHKFSAHGGAYKFSNFKNGGTGTRGSKKLYPCDLCGKLLTAASLDFHRRTHQDIDQKSSEHQAIDQKSSEHQDIDQKSSEHQAIDQKSSEHQDIDQKSSEHQDIDKKSLYL